MSRWIAFAAAAAALGAGACSTDQPAVCESLGAVQHTLTRIRDANVSENGLTQLRADLAVLKNDLDQLLADTKEEFGAEADAVRTAMSQFSASLATARATPDAASLSAVRSAMNLVVAGVRDLGDDLSGTC
jgi:hypothetical protein